MAFNMSHDLVARTDWKGFTVCASSRVKHILCSIG